MASQAKQNNYRMTAGIELEDYASRREMSNQHLVKARSSPRQTWMVSGKLVATDNFAASPSLHYMTTEDHLKPANWWLAKNFDSLTAAFCRRDLWSQIRKITNTAWKNTCGTLPVQLQQWQQDFLFPQNVFVAAGDDAR